jgi:hypothetical protein
MEDDTLLWTWPLEPGYVIAAIVRHAKVHPSLLDYRRVSTVCLILTAVDRHEARLQGLGNVSQGGSHGRQ